MSLLYFFLFYFFTYLQTIAGSIVRFHLSSAFYLQHLNTNRIDSLITAIANEESTLEQ